MNENISNQLIQLEKYGEEVLFTKTDNPITYENSENYFYIIFSGKIKVFNINLDTGREQILYMLNKGDMFDVITLLDEKPHDVSTEVLEEGMAVQIPIGRVRQWMNDNQSFKAYLLPYISNQLRNLEDLASDLSLLNTSERLTKLILKDIQFNGELLRGLSNTEIGNLIGTVRHVIERHLKNNNLIKKQIGTGDTKPQ